MYEGTPCCHIHRTTSASRSQHAPYDFAASGVLPMISSPALHRPAGSRSQVFEWLLYLDSVNSWDSEGARGSLPDWQGEVFPPGGQAEALARSLLSSTHECDPLHPNP